MRAAICSGSIGDIVADQYEVRGALAHGGMGLGSAFGPKKYEGLVKEAGFLSFDTVGSNPMNNFCERRSVRLPARPVRSCFALSNWRWSCRRDQGRYRHPGVAVSNGPRVKPTASRAS